MPGIAEKRICNDLYPEFSALNSEVSISVDSEIVDGSKIINNKEKYEYLAENGKKLIHSMYNIDKFDEVVFSSIGLKNE